MLLGVLLIALDGGAPAAAREMAPLQRLSPVQVFKVHQTPSVAPQPLPPAPLPLESPYASRAPRADGLSPKLSYRLFPSLLPAEPWRSQLSDSSPGLRGPSWRWRRAPRLASPWQGRSDRNWIFGAENWRYIGPNDLSITLGSETLTAPAWGHADRIAGLSVTGSALDTPENKQAWKYSLSIGALDRSGGLQPGDLEYGETVSNVVTRYGLSPTFTLESELQVAPDMRTAGVGGTYESSWGDWTLGFARAHALGDDGWRYQAVYSLDILEDVKLTWMNERYTPGFMDINRYGDTVLSGGTRQQLSASVGLGRWGEASSSFETARSGAGDEHHRFGFSQQFWYSPNLRVDLQAGREFASGDYDIGIRLAIPLF